MNSLIAMLNIKNGLMIKELRDRAELSREALAQIIGISKTTIYRIEKGDPKFMTESLDKICEPFGIRTEDLPDLNIDNLNAASIWTSIQLFMERKGVSQDAKITVKKSRENYNTKPMHLVKKLIAEGFFKEYKRPVEVRDQIFEVFKISIDTPTLSNTLKSNKALESTGTGIKNYKKYRVKKRPAK